MSNSAALDAIEKRVDILEVNLRTLAHHVCSQAEHSDHLESELRRERARAEQFAAQRLAELREPGVRPSLRQSRDVKDQGGQAIGRAAVISWDMGHNPLGRAMVLYDLLDVAGWDTELVGPLWSRYGGKLWPPVARSNRKFKAFPCETLEQFWPSALGFAATARYDLVVICKPRLPAILLGALIAKTSKCPIILDVDDFELSFTNDERPASLDELVGAEPTSLLEPYGHLATRACESVIRDVKSITVSNVALRARYGGLIVRHARDEEAFAPKRFDRQQARHALGIAPSDFAIIFVGTPRRHKGVLQIAKTLAEIQDSRFALHIVGELTDRRDLKELESYDKARIYRHPGCDFDALPGIIAAADAVVLLQDADHPVSQYQIPAKISDAAAFGLPIIMTDVPPVRDLRFLGVVQTIDPQDLRSKLQELIDKRDKDGESFQISVREAFESEFGFGVNIARLDLAIARAREGGEVLPRSFERLIDIAEQAYKKIRSEHYQRWPVIGSNLKSGYDLVLFWKQNDSRVYGRRPDMLAKYFLESGKVRKVLQFDAPVEINEIGRLVSGQTGKDSAQFLSLANIIDDQWRLRDTPSYKHRSYIWSRGESVQPIFASAGNSLDQYPAFVAAQMADAGIDPSEAIAWVCPVIFDFPAIAAAVPFKARIGDLIDDQRTFEMAPAYRRRIEESYERTLPLLDFAFTNCEPLAEAFGPMLREIYVVPNGTELPDSSTLPDAPELAGIQGPIVGYVGNLRDRIDWTLLHDTALLIPEAKFVVVGGGARPNDIEAIRKLPNVVFTGVVPYERVLPVMRGFDVAIMPHLKTPQTDRMNPLKIYNYLAARRPVVTTPVNNIDVALKPYLRFADDADAFAAAIRESFVSNPTRGWQFEAALSDISWESRAAQILNIFDKNLQAHDAS